MKLLTVLVSAESAVEVLQPRVNVGRPTVLFP
jgi:hypothetical protein